MNKIIFISFLGVMGFLGTIPGPAAAQSTAEYSTLVSTIAAAAKAQKEKGQNQDQGGQQGSSTKIIEPENKTTQAPTPAGETKTSENKRGPMVKVYLRSGTVVEGELIERKEDHIKVNTAGFPITYFNEEITRIEESSEE